MTDDEIEIVEDPIEGGAIVSFRGPLLGRMQARAKALGISFEEYVTELLRRNGAPVPEGGIREIIEH